MADKRFDFVKWKHDELAHDLGDSLAAQRRMIWYDLQLGPGGSMRPDVYTMMKSFSNPSPMAYEVKVSRGDLLRDLKDGKCLAYFSAADQVYMCFPQGMATPDEIPPELGIRIRCANSWRTLRRAPTDRSVIATWVWHKLIIDGVDREREACADRLINVYAELEEKAAAMDKDYHKWRDDIGHREYTVKQLETRAADAQENLDKLQKSTDTLLEEVAGILGVETIHAYDVQRFRFGLARSLMPDEVAVQLQQSLNEATHSISRLLEHVTRHRSAIKSGEADAQLG